MASPKSLSDFKKANKTTNQSTILTPNKTQQTLSLDDMMQQPIQQPEVGFKDNIAPYQEQFQQKQEFQQGDFPSELKPNFESAFQKVESMGMDNITYANNQQNDNYAQSQSFVANNVPAYSATAPSQETNHAQAQNSFTASSGGYMQTKEEPKQQNVQQPYVAQPYQNVTQTFVPEKKHTNNKSIVSHMQEIEKEIDALVSNTEAFLQNTTALKVKILNVSSREELETIMQEVHTTLAEIPQSFIDAETRRRIRLCFSYLQKTKKELLDMEDQLKESQESLKKLVSIDNIEELEEVILNTPASPTVDNIYDVRTFEINLVNELPTIKEEMLRERMLAVYNG